MPTLPLVAPVVVQFLVNDGRSRECWQTTYTNLHRNTATQVKAIGP